MEGFVKQLKKQLIDEFRSGDRKGVYAFTQKSMAYYTNSTSTCRQIGQL